jgi:AmmeMemoRadiSam system protein B
MPSPERPKLRPYLAAQAEDRRGQRFVLTDRLRLSNHYLRVNAAELELLQLFDGQRTLRDVQGLTMLRYGGQIIPLEVFSRLADALEEAMFLDGPRYRELIEAPVRAPICIGCYEGEPKSLRRQLKRFFTAPDASGLPGEVRPDGSIRAALVPHIDYARGGATYTWPFREIVERSDASLFVVVGTSHFSSERFTLTRKNFETPLGIVPTDQTYIDRLVKHYGDGLFEDELGAHLPEHSIELEVVLLQYLYEHRRPIRIVPLVVGSFHDSMARGCKPSECDDIGRMIEALRAVERETPEPICYVISGDLAHIGPKFGDPDGSLDDVFLMHSRNQDDEIMARAEAVDADGYYRVIEAENDVRRICGLPPTYLVLQAAQPSAARRLHYGCYVHPQGHESVSFAGMAFYR